MKVLAKKLVAAMTSHVVLAVLFLTALTLSGGSQQRKPRRTRPAPQRTSRAARRTEAVDARRFAEEIHVAAARAGDSARNWQEFWAQSEEYAADAWQAWQDAEKQLARTRAATAFRSPHFLQTPSEYAENEKFLHRAAAKAVDRGDLPSTVLVDLAAGEGGWNPMLHPVEQELVLQMATAAVRRHMFEQATEAEESAWHDAQLAVAVRDSLRREAGEATVRAAALARYLPSRERAAAPALRPSLVHQTA
ncbi:hypothetical protein [Actinoplanes rectilineatus]|uniref:hypothetical protein n=1 Tax=Actinoplanes rectilineatus TaxID=113571 RepID=UPI0012FC68C9|nr:hypothetical protein [Actinoplanes rectilineatus]